MLRFWQMTLTIWACTVLLSTSWLASVRQADSATGWLIFKRVAYGATVYRIGVDGTQLHAITSPEEPVYAPSLSPDGQWIAYSSTDAQLHRIRTDGSQQEQLTHPPGRNDAPTWSPDSQWLTFIASQPSHAEIYRMRADGSQRQRLHQSPAYFSAPRWSPDGQWIVFIAGQEKDRHLFRMRPDGSELRQLTQASHAYTSFSWLLDRQSFLLTTSQGGRIDLYQMQVDGGPLIHVGYYNDQLWLPSGEYMPLRQGDDLATAIIQLINKANISLIAEPTYEPVSSLLLLEGGEQAIISGGLDQPTLYLQTQQRALRPLHTLEPFFLYQLLGSRRTLSLNMAAIVLLAMGLWFMSIIMPLLQHITSNSKR